MPPSAGDSPNPLFAGFHPAGGYPPSPYLQGIALPSSINPNPFFIRRGFNLHPKPLCPLQGRGLTDFGQKPPFIRLWYRSRSLCPYGASDGF